MKKICLVLFVLLGYFSVTAQDIDTVPPYKKDPKMPAFLIQQGDSSWFSAEQLPKYDYTAIIYFQPTCGHCQIMAKDIVSHRDSLKNVFFVMVSFNPINEIREFANYYGLDVLPNVRAGRDPKYSIPTFYKVRYTPFTAIYNADHKLIEVYDPPFKNAMEASDLIRLIYKK